MILQVCFYIVERPARKYFVHIMTSPLSAKGCFLLVLMAFEQGFIVPHLWHEASVFCGRTVGPSHLVALYDKQEVLKTYSNHSVRTGIAHFGSKYIYCHQLYNNMYTGSFVILGICIWHNRCLGKRSGSFLVVIS